MTEGLSPDCAIGVLWADWRNGLFVWSFQKDSRRFGDGRQPQAKELHPQARRVERHEGGSTARVENDWIYDLAWLMQGTQIQQEFSEELS
jgi:hypothetical protein